MPKGFVYTPQEGDPLSIEKMQLALRRGSNKTLILDYNRQDLSGFFGVRRQLLWVVALHQVFLERFGRSPIQMEKSGMVTTTGPVAIIEDDWIPLGPNNRPEDPQLN